MVAININDVKKDWIVRTHDGQEQWVFDNKKGLIRMVKAKTPQGSWDIGSTYAFRWFQAKDPETSEVYQIKLTEAQIKKARKIQQMGF